MFSSVIKDLRSRSNLSQKDLAEAVFISPSAISQYENGRAMPSRETLNHLAQYFGVSVNYLLGSSANEDIEAILTGDFIDGVRMSEFVRLCNRLDPADRTIIYRFVSNVVSPDDLIITHKKEKISR